MRSPSGTLFVVGTPIGNLSDITLRAIETLRAAHRVAAEDTRRTRGLLTHLGISGKPLDRIDAHASPRDIQRIVERLTNGEHIALVTDGGMPSISDPGQALVQAASAAGVPVVVIPGPSAVTAAVAASGLVTSGFLFLGFLPRSGASRDEALAHVSTTPEAVVLFEAPNRTAATLRDLAALMPSRDAAVLRELTKLHEEIARGTLAALSEQEREWPGEITIVIAPDEHAGAAAAVDDEAVDRRIDEALGRAEPVKSIASQVAAWAGRSRREVYARVLERKARTSA
jgi:16S rRNA (cytidine1402-2'-O)-methyltransferase